METLFSKVSDKYQPAHREKLVYFNLKNNQVSLDLNDFKSAWNRVVMTKPIVETYLAKLKTDVRGSTGQFRVDDFATGKHINLIVEYMIQINETKLEYAFRSYLRSSELETVFNNHIKDIVQDYNRNNPLVNSPDTYIPELNRYLTAQLCEFEPGYSPTCRINLVDFIPEKEQVNSEGLKVRFKGGKDEITIHFKSEVAIDSFRRDAARQSVLKDKNQLRVHLQELVKAYFLERVIQVNFFDRSYRRATLTEELESYLNLELRLHGRKLVFFEFNETTLREHSAPAGISALPVQVGCQVRHASKFIPLDVSTKVTMELGDEGQAVIAGMTSRGALEGWAMKNIKEIVETTFLEQKDFADIVIAFFDGNNTIESAIGDELRKRADDIGYKLKYYSVLPNLSKYENKRVEISDSAMEFKTKGGDIPLFLSFEVEGGIKSWGAIKEYLRPDKDLNKNIKDKTIAAIKEILLENYADRLYMHFYEPFDGKFSVEKELQDKITDALEEFKLEDLKIRLIPAESDIKTRFAKVLNKITRVSIVFKSLRKDSLPEDIHYHFSYRIIGIDRENSGFNVFYSSKDLEIDYWMEEISKLLKSKLISFLNTIDAPLVKYEHEKIRQFLEERFKLEHAIPEIKRGFGLEIDLHEFRRDLTEKEKVESQTASHYFAEKGKSDQERITKELSGLLDSGEEETETIKFRLNELYLYGNFKTPDQEAEIKRLEMRLAELHDRKESVVDRLHARYGGESNNSVDPLALLEAAKQQLLPPRNEKKEESETE